ncbi:MAG: substrate-binding domain-containing protein [Acidobacteriota bacterium]
MCLFTIRIVRIISILTVLALVLSCGNDPEQNEKKEILAYVGITMAKPMAEITKAVEEKSGVSIIITQGGSQDLYQSLMTAQQGDLYLPGSASYREENYSDGLLGNFVLVGYNQAAFMVAKENPKGVTADIEQILRDDLAIVLCNPESGSIGRETKKILSAAGIFEEAFERAEYLTTDSRNLSKALRDGDADLVINWRSSAFFDENRPVMEVVDLAPELAEPNELLLNLLTFSKYPEIAREVMAYSVSPEGQAIFRKFGFLDASGNSGN